MEKKEAMKILKDFRDKLALFSVRTALDTIIPELKESDDERIRKEILSFLRKGQPYYSPNSTKRQEWAAWLEKAVTPTPQDWNDYKDKPVELWNMYVKGLANGIERGKDAVKNHPQDYGLEKQGEHESTSWKPTKEQYGALDYAFNCCPDTELGNYFEGVLSTLIEDLHKLENQSEQKPDKVEPKFKVGDYVVGKYISGYISEIRNNCYLLDYQGFSIDKQNNYHLWTIQDAKDGDVLVDGNFIVIFKENNYNPSDKSGCMCVYCSFDINNDDFYTESGGYNPIYFYPATKVQRALLFQKMHEAGYEWDAEKKEVKKIGNEEVNGEDYGIDGLWHAQRILEKTLGNVDGYQSDDGVLDHKAAITAVKKLYEIKPILEDAANALLQALSDSPYNNTPIVEAQDAVKQLLTFLSDPKSYNPDVINNHESAEWSEEDKQLIDEVAVCLRKYAEKVQGGNSKFYVQSLADRIESLRPGNTCKATGWSKEDEAMFQGVIETEQYMLDVVYGRKFFAVGNESIKEECTKELAWLKSLKDRIK